MKIFLIGFMGSGKSYVAKRLADLAGYTAIDLDELIEQKANKSIAEIFEEDGESTFRILEKEYLYQLRDVEDVVLATGGGTPCFFENLQWMKKNGIVVYLKASPQILSKRLLGQQQHRPLIAGKSAAELLAFIENKLAERKDFYEAAALIYEQKSGTEDIAMDIFNYFLKNT